MSSLRHIASCLQGSSMLKPVPEFNFFLRLNNIPLLEKEMATHSSTIAWKIPWTQEPGRLQSMGSQRVGHNWAKAIKRQHSIIGLYNIVCIIHLSVDFWIISTFGYCEHLHTGVQKDQICVFSSFEYIRKSGLTILDADFMFTFLRNCYTLFHHSYTVLHSHLIAEFSV